MKIGITGATGFIGRHVISHAQVLGHQMVAYTRRQYGFPVVPAAETLTQPATAPHHLPETRLDALVHLAGETLMGFWTRAKRERIYQSRVNFTRQLAQGLAAWRPENRPRILICASGAGIYGDRAGELLDENSPPGTGFLAELCVEWEKAAQEAASLGIRVVNLRTAMVLGNDGGAFPLLRRVFGLGLGGRLGNGRQWTPWIHVADAAALVVRAVEAGNLHGPLNVCAPQPVTNAEFTRTLATALRRPAIFHAPALVLRLLLRGMAEEMLLSSQRVNPRVAAELGYPFSYPSLSSALGALLGARSGT